MRAQAAASLEHRERITDGIRMVDVVGDEDDRQVLLARPGDVAQDGAGLFHAEGAGRLVEDEDPGAEVDGAADRSEEHTSELQSRGHLVCRLLLEKKRTQT